MNRGVVGVSLMLLIVVSAGGCQVVKKGTDTKAYAKLGEWQGIARNAAPGASYLAAQNAINGWITAKQTQLAVVGGQLWGDVKLDDFPPELQKAVDKVTAPEPASVAGDLLDWLLKRYEKGRKDEAAAHSGKLEAYKWPDKS